MTRLAFVTIGNEILSGRTHDTNFNYIAKIFTQNGLNFHEVRVIRDEEQVIIDTVLSLHKTYDYVITSGGIGPTHDDITTESISKALKVDYEIDPEARLILEEYYRKNNKEMNTARLKMAYLPRGSKMIPNKVSAAPGFFIQNIFCLAGVPEVFKSMVDEILPLLVKGDPIHSRTIEIPLTEGEIGGRLAEIAYKYGNDTEIGSYPNFKTGITSLVIRGKSLDKISEVEGVIKNEFIEKNP